VLAGDELDAIVAGIDAAADRADVKAALDIAVRRLGFDRFAYVQLQAPRGVRERLYLGTYDAAWSEHYRRRDLQLHDPLWGYAFQANRPFLWEDVKRQADAAADRLVFGPGAEVGLRAGAGIPIHSAGGAVATLHVAKDCEAGALRMLFAAARHTLQVIAYAAHDRVLALSAAAGEPAVRLSARQKEVLLWVVRGKTNWEIGELLDIAEDTVRQHLIKASRLLGATNRTQAATLAVARHLITS